MLPVKHLLKPISWSRIVTNLYKTEHLYSRNVSNQVKKTSALTCKRMLPQLPANPLLNVTRSYSTDENNLNEAVYERIADETLDSLTEAFDELPETMDCDPEYDVTFGSGVLTVKINNSWGTYVINKQVPNKQIWFSSPISGPKRYDFIDGIWIYKHDSDVLHELLNKEISEALGQSVDFTNCVYGRR